MISYEEAERAYENEILATAEDMQEVFDTADYEAVDDDKEEELEEDADWGDVDPAGGPAPSAPGSAV